MYEIWYFKAPLKTNPWFLLIKSMISYKMMPYTLILVQFFVHIIPMFWETEAVDFIQATATTIFCSYWALSLPIELSQCVTWGEKIVHAQYSCYSFCGPLYSVQRVVLHDEYTTNGLCIQLLFVFKWLFCKGVMLLPNCAWNLSNA